LRYGDNPNLTQEYASIHVKALLDHEIILQQLYNRLLKSHVGEAEGVRERQAFEAELAELITSAEEPSLPISGVPNKNMIEDREAAVKEASWLSGLAYAFKVSPERKARLDRRWKALKVFGEALEDADAAVKKRVSSILKTYNSQMGPGYFRGKKPIYSGPQNPAVRPTGSPFIPEGSTCFCPKCGEDRENTTPLEPCEHSICLKCGSILKTRLYIPGDTRKPFDPNADRDMTKP
jgi:hypothetical protein